MAASHLVLGVALCYLLLLLPVVNSEYLIQLSREDQDRIVNIHNRRRSMVVPEAANMQKVVISLLC